MIKLTMALTRETSPDVMMPHIAKVNLLASIGKHDTIEDSKGKEHKVYKAYLENAHLVLIVED